MTFFVNQVQRDYDDAQVHAQMDADREREAIEAEELEERARDEALGMLAALEAVSTEARDVNADGDVVIPSHVWDLVSAAIAKIRRSA